MGDIQLMLQSHPVAWNITQIITWGQLSTQIGNVNSLKIVCDTCMSDVPHKTALWVGALTQVV